MNPSDDIGLTDFLVLIYKFLKRNILIIGLTTIVGFGISIIYAKQKPKYYSSELVGLSNLINKTILLELFNPITILIEEENYPEISNKLGITEKEAANIRSIEFRESRHLVTSHSPDVTDKKLGELILVKVMVYDKSTLPPLEKGITAYVENNSFITYTRKLELQKTNTLISEITQNLNVIDSINKVQIKSKTQSSISISGTINPVNYNETAELLGELRLYKKTLKPFTIVSGFYTAKSPSNKILMIIAAITFAFFSLSLIFVFIKELATLAT
jgi:hypothetical protein